jgi:hypothetical protein
VAGVLQAQGGVQLTRRSLRPLLDALCLLAAFVLALLVRFRFETSTIDVQWYWVSLGLFAGVDIGYLYLRGMYDNGHVTADRTAVVVDGLVYATFLYLLIAYLVKNTLFSRLTLAYFLVLSLILQVELERAVVAIRRHRYAHGLDLVPAIVVGAVEDLAAAGLDAPGLQRGLGMQLLHTEAGTVAVKSFGQLEAVLGGGAARAVLLASSLPDISQIVELCLRQYVTVYALGGTVRTLPYPSDVLFVNHTPLLRVRDLLIVGVGARGWVGRAGLLATLACASSAREVDVAWPCSLRTPAPGRGGHAYPCLQVPLHGGGRRGAPAGSAGRRPVITCRVRGDVQAEAGSPSYAAGAMAETDVDGRTAPAVQRSPWRPLAGRTSPHCGGRDCQVWAGVRCHPAGSPRGHRSMAGQRAQ